jgi:hypothetical protein
MVDPPCVVEHDRLALGEEEDVPEGRLELGAFQAGEVARVLGARREDRGDPAAT